MSTPDTSASGAAWVVPLSDVLVEDDLLEAARETLQSGWWSMGARVAAFEREFAGVCGTEYALAVANGTAALHLALLAVGCGPGDEVVLPSLNFVAAANAVLHIGATPVFCDIKGDHDLNLDPTDLEAALTERTGAVIALHYGGHPCEIERVVETCRERRVAVIEDAAHAIGSRRNGTACGSFGDVGCFSFFSNKNLPIGEGGMVVTNDAALAENLRLLRSHGMTTLTWDRHRGHASGYDVVRPGFNYRLDDLRAALGSVQLARLADRDSARRRHVARYRAALDGKEGVIVPFGDDPSAVNHIAVVVLPASTSRNAVRDRLAVARIQTSVHYPPIHEFSAFEQAGRGRELPRTAAIRDRILTLPLYPHMTEGDVDLVVEELMHALGSADSDV